MATNTTNYGLTKPEGNEYYDVSVSNGNMDIIDSELKKLDDNKLENADLPSSLPNPSALTISQGYGGTTGSYDGSAAVSVSVPHVTFHTADPTTTLADGELWVVY